MKAKFQLFPYMPACIVLLSMSCLAQDESISGNLTVAGWARFGGGIDVGNTSQHTLDWDSNNLSVSSDINSIQGSFVWRDSYTFDNNNVETFRSKLLLDSANLLTLFKSNGTSVGLTLDPNSGRIVLPSGVEGVGLYSGSNPIISVNSNGAVAFPVSTMFQSGIVLSGGQLSVLSTTPSTSSATGAFVVAGGMGVGGDSWINGVRVGKGAGSIESNTVLGLLALNSNTTGAGNTGIGWRSLKANSTGYNNTAVGYQSLTSNTTGTYNTALGLQSLVFNTTGNFNTAAGFGTLYKNTTGIGNAALGGNSLFNLVDGSGNTAVGTVFSFD